MARKRKIVIKRVYEPAADGDGTRFLVDRLWPRGVARTTMQMDAWLQDVAPSGTLRRWFGHDASRWDEFQRRYFAELDGNPDAWQPILAAAARNTVTLLYAARDPEMNHALALKRYLDAQ